MIWNNYYFGNWEDYYDQLPNAELCFTDPPYGQNFIKKKHAQLYAQDIVYADSRLDFEWVDKMLEKCDGVFFSCGTTNFYKWIQQKEPTYKHKVCYMPNTGSPCHLEYFLGYGKIKRITHIRDVFVIKAKHFSGLLHPSPKPLDMYRYLLTKLNPESIIDPFFGSGTSGQIATELGIKWVGIEKNKQYEKDIKKRLRNCIKIPVQKTITI